MSSSLARLALAAFLYGAIGVTANAAAGDVAALSAADRAAIDQLRSGDMAKLIVHDQPKPRLDGSFVDQAGVQHSVAEYAGKVVLVNFWATWCPPCRAEMPSIDRLAAALAGDDFAVIPLSNDRTGIERPARFFEEIEVKNLELMLDRGGKLALHAGVLGLPVTLILDRQGREIARMIGAAQWDGPDAKALLRRVIEITGRDRA